jgi:hypothetical protein
MNFVTVKPKLSSPSTSPAKPIIGKVKIEVQIRENLIVFMMLLSFTFALLLGISEL